MFKYFWMKMRALATTPAGRADPDWRADPLAHPVLRQMSERELADLPFEPRCYR